MKILAGKLRIPIHPILKIVLAGIILIALSIRCISEKPPLTSFTTGGHIIYQLKPARVKMSGKPAIVAASYDGTILCYTSEGKLFWENNDHNYFPYDLATADIDNDGLDETLVATAGGTIDVLDSDGTHLWSFKRGATLYQVCPVKTSSGEWIILAGGIEKEVYTISAEGVLLNSFEAGDVVRHIRKGDIFGDGKEYAAIVTVKKGIGPDLKLILFDPETSKALWKKEKIAKLVKDVSNRLFFSMIMFDMNKDGRQDIVISGSWRNGTIFGFDYEGNPILSSIDERIPRAVYRMNLLTRVNMKGNPDEKIFGLYSDMITVYNSEGIIEKMLNSKYDFTSGTFDPETNTYYLGSSVSGDDMIFALHLDVEGWEKAFEEIKSTGRIAEVKKNITHVEEQVSKFQKPDYQPVPSNITIAEEKPDTLNFEHLTFEPLLKLFEKYGDRKELWCRDVDDRHEYNMTPDEILAIISEKEAKGEDFILFSGHGAAFYMSPDVLEKAIKAAPKHLKGFLFSEMSSVDADMQEVVKELMLPLAEKCSMTGKKIILLNKMVFWTGSIYLDFWKEVLLNPKYSDVFVPSLEESNSRTQELSLAGRVGLWQTGSFDHWSGRVIRDNTNFDRMWEWSAGHVISHHLRQLVLNASMGADIFTGTSDQYLLFYQMLEKGIIAIPGKDDLLSVTDLCLGMKSPPAEDYLYHGINGGTYDFIETKKNPMIFDRLDVYWAGANILDHDFSQYGYGCVRRFHNFLPEYPYGLIPIVPDGTDLTLYPRFKEKITIDGHYFYDKDGKQHDPVEYKQEMVEKLRQSAAKLPVLVKGSAWSTVRLDPDHVRVTLVDPGYINPADRDAEILIQNRAAVECTDILSGEKLEIRDQKIKVRVPAGVFRIIDITF